MMSVAIRLLPRSIPITTTPARQWEISIACGDGDVANDPMKKSLLRFMALVLGHEVPDRDRRG
jgi:hypothetical protein